MKVLNTAELTRAGKKNKPLRSALAEWLETTEAAIWDSIQDARKTFSSADGVPIKIAGQGIAIATVFNIKGNEFRLIATINYAAQIVVVMEVLTHAEYSKDAWKGRL